MHTEFLSAIQEEPDTPDHRLVYADWLEEHGTTALDSARAALIRVQMALEAANPETDDYWYLRAAERVLIAEWGERLAGPLHRIAYRYRFRRGFVEWLDLSVDAWIDCLNRNDQPPTVRALQFRGGFNTLRPRHLHGIDWLDLRHVRGGRNADLSRALGAMPLRSLELPKSFQHGWFELRDFALFHSVERLGFPASVGGWNTILGELLDSEPPTELRSLRVDLDGEMPGNLEEFASSEWLRSLRELEFHSEPIANRSLLSLLSWSPAAVRLRTFRHDDADFRARGNDYGPYLNGLVELELSGSPGPAREVGEFLLKLPALRELRLMAIEGVECVDELSRLIRGQLRCFELDGMGIAEDRETLLADPGAISLRRLRLPGTDARILTRCPKLAEFIAPTSKAEPIVLSLGEVDRHPMLTTLDCPGQILDVESLGRLLDRGAFPALARVDLRGGNQVSGVRAKLSDRLGLGARLGTSLADLRDWCQEDALAEEYRR